MGFYNINFNEYCLNCTIVKRLWIMLNFSASSFKLYFIWPKVM